MAETRNAVDYSKYGPGFENRVVSPAGGSNDPSLLGSSLLTTGFIGGLMLVVFFSLAQWLGGLCVGVCAIMGWTEVSFQI